MNFEKWLLSESMKITDALTVLYLEPNFTKEELIIAFRDKSKLYHPDRASYLDLFTDGIFKYLWF